MRRTITVMVALLLTAPAVEFLHRRREDRAGRHVGRLVLPSR